MSRTHVVMIPGFGGFDVLGQIFYYAGVTYAFRAWLETLPSAAPGHRLALHYFDNLPTAGVRTRAMALRAYLEERIFRADFAPDDRIALVGHSTGGLDIRQLLVDLNAGFDARFRTVTDPCLVSDDAILRKVSRLVFLSVPQRGTNIADFTRRFRLAIRAGAEQVEVGLRASQLGLFETIERRFWEWATVPEETPQLLAAIRDALFESFRDHPLDTPSDRYAAALARASYHELLGWIDGVKADFFAIDDLACEGDELTPARYAAPVRAEERAAWSARGIRTRSYATIGSLPYGEAPRTEPYDTWELPWLLRALGPDAAVATDWVYRFAYAATAAGPFTTTPGGDYVEADGLRRHVAAWENDGIVNTASMLWPDGPDTRLVPGDHGDIIGHFALGEAVKASETLPGRRDHRYDLLGSDSGFGEAEFAAIWSEIFDFCSAP